MRYLFALLMLALGPSIFGQNPPPGALSPGVPLDLARWRAAHYSDVRYKLNLTLEKMSPVLKGTMEIRVRVSGGDGETGSGGGSESVRSAVAGGVVPIVLDWRKIKGHEERSTVSKVSINGLVLSPGFSRPLTGGKPPEGGTPNAFEENNEHLIFRDGVVAGENVIKLDFTSPILTSGSAITRYVDKEDGSEYIYSLFVPSDASTAFPVFDQPDLKARFTLTIVGPADWNAVANESAKCQNYQTGKIADVTNEQKPAYSRIPPELTKALNSPEVAAAIRECALNTADLTHSFAAFPETKPISTYVFAFAAGPFEAFRDTGGNASVNERASGTQRTIGAVSTLPDGRVSARTSVRRSQAANFMPREAGPFEKFDSDRLEAGLPAKNARVDGRASPPLNRGSDTDGLQPPATAGGTDKMADLSTSIYVRKSQAAKFKPHAAEVFRLNREAIKYFEEYFDYKFPFPKYDLVLIPEFPFGGMEHAGATFLRESSIIFPQEPTKNDHISRALLMFHEASHQWFGDTVTMRWFDDLWLKEGFATFTAYKAMEKIMPEMLAWKVFYERVKQAAYQTDSTKGTVAIYQPIANLSAAKSAYGAIVYSKAPAFLRQAEFYLGEDKFQTAVRAFLKKHEFGNSGWEDLVREFETAKGEDLKQWARSWVLQKGLPIYTIDLTVHNPSAITHTIASRSSAEPRSIWKQRVEVLQNDSPRGLNSIKLDLNHRFAGDPLKISTSVSHGQIKPDLFFLNSKDYGYGIFLLDEKSRDYVLKNVQNEKDPFLRSMMWGALWDSVREGELDPRVFVELVVKVLSPGFSRQPPESGTPNEGGTPNEDESTTALLLNRVSTAMNYYIGDRSVPPAVAGGARVADKRASDGRRPDARSLTVASLHERVEDMLIERMRNAPSLGQRITYYRAFLNVAASEKARGVLKELLRQSVPGAAAAGSGAGRNITTPSAEAAATPPQTGGESKQNPGGNASVNERASEGRRPDARSLTVASLPVRTKDKFDIVTRLLILNDPEAPKLLAELEKTETSDDAKRYAYAAKAGGPTAENKAKYWNDFVNNKEISESWIEAAFGPWNSIRHSNLTLPYLERALKELPNHKRNRKIFFVNGWLGAFIGGQRSEEALAIVNKFLADNPNLDNDLRLKILENADVIERAVRIRAKYKN